MSNVKNTKFSFAALDFLWTLIAYIYFISKPYVVIAGIFYVVPIVLKSFKHWVQKDQTFMFYVYSVIFTIVNVGVLALQISVQFGILPNLDWVKYLLVSNTIYTFLGVAENYEPYNRVSKGGKK